MACTHWQIVEGTFSIIYTTNHIDEFNSGLLVTMLNRNVSKTEKT